MRSRPSRYRAAAAFAAVGLLAGGAHVVATDIASQRLWREVLPLACLIGAILGALTLPTGWRRGALVAFVAAPAFALAYSVAEVAMMIVRGEITDFREWMMAILHWLFVVLDKATIGALVATLAGAAAGRWLGRSQL